MLQSVATPPPQPAFFDGSGPVWGLGAERSQPEWALNSQVSGVPSVYPGQVISAPPIPYRQPPTIIALGIGAVRDPALDLQSFSPAPPVPLNSRPKGTVVLQINGPNVNKTIVAFSAPRVPTGGASPCQVSARQQVGG